ncbi:transcription factor Adf-1-like [Thalassophryne amazonica]|uniref:transcription factor Adf-1-like n=1 Tax=Thalassophryne amazonica TaxID=390379 RepID=UPI001471D105|nr:transcription factor Adf-1-like [Thalassophryne amazonica]
MEEFKVRLAALVRSYKHLYDSSLREYKDYQLVQNSWKEIAALMGKDANFCRKVWKNTRDYFVKAKKRMRGRSGGNNKLLPPIVNELEWLSEFVKHRESDGINVKSEDTDSSQKYAVHPETISSSAATSAAKFTQSENSAFSAVGLSTPESTPETTPPSPIPPSPSLSVSSHPSASSASPCRSVRKRKHPADEDLLHRLEELNEEHRRAVQHSSEDFHFAVVISDMLSKIDPEHKSEIKFKVYKLLFEAEMRYGKE